MYVTVSWKWFLLTILPLQADGGALSLNRTIKLVAFTSQLLSCQMPSKNLYVHQCCSWSRKFWDQDRTLTIDNSVMITTALVFCIYVGMPNVSDYFWQNKTDISLYRDRNSMLMRDRPKHIALVSRRDRDRFPNLIGLTWPLIETELWVFHVVGHFDLGYRSPLSNFKDARHVGYFNMILSKNCSHQVIII